MIRKSMWHVRDKWKRHLALAGHRLISKHIPPTRLLNTGNLIEYLRRYKVIFLKPVIGSYGNNIMKVTRHGTVYLVHREKWVKHVSSRKIVGELSGNVRGRRYLIQQGISLLSIAGNPVDFRLLLLKPGKEWIIMGTMGKVATANRIVTNFNHGGRPIRLEDALRQTGWNDANIRRIQTRMNRIALITARIFTKRYIHCRRLGVDIAIDRNKRIWILEVNTNPSYELFRHHKNRQLYGKIKRFMNKILARQSNY